MLSGGSLHQSVLRDSRLVGSGTFPAARPYVGPAGKPERCLLLMSTSSFAGQRFSKHNVNVPCDYPGFQRGIPYQCAVVEPSLDPFYSDRHTFQTGNNWKRRRNRTGGSVRRWGSQRDRRAKPRNSRARFPLKTNLGAVGLPSRYPSRALLTVLAMPDPSQRTIAKNYKQLWEDVANTSDESEAVQPLAKIVVNRQGRAFILGLEREKAELCVRILDHVGCDPPFVLLPLPHTPLVRASQNTTSNLLRNVHSSSC